MGIGGSCPKIACLPSKKHHSQCEDCLERCVPRKYTESGAELVLGSGRFIGPKTLQVTLPDGTTRELRGANVIISTAMRAALEPIPGLLDAKPLTHIEALELDEIPERLVVIGGGYVGIELSQAMRRFGSKVSPSRCASGSPYSRGGYQVWEATTSGRAGASPITSTCRTSCKLRFCQPAGSFLRMGISESGRARILPASSVP
jgi:pyridine nucleotide-disulfide oxidoreductase